MSNNKEKLHLVIDKSLSTKTDYHRKLQYLT